MQGLVYWGCAEGKLGSAIMMKSQIVANVESGITGVLTHRLFNLRKKMYHDPYNHGEVMSYQLRSATSGFNNPQGH